MKAIITIETTGLDALNKVTGALSSVVDESGISITIGTPREQQAAPRKSRTQDQIKADRNELLSVLSRPEVASLTPSDLALELGKTASHEIGYIRNDLKALEAEGKVTRETIDGSREQVWGMA